MCFIFSDTSFVVKRDGGPYFIETPTNITVNEGELAVLKCEVEQLITETVILCLVFSPFIISLNVSLFNQILEQLVQNALSRYVLIPLLSLQHTVT